MSATGSRWGPFGLLGLGLLAVGFLVFWPPIPQDPCYHAFADRRPWLGIPNFADVVSNLPFLLVGLYGAVWILRSGPDSAAWRSLHSWERYAWFAFLASLSATALGSAYYHWDPTTPTLFWDRLPMATTFMSFFALFLSDRFSLARGGWVCLALNTVGIASVLYWRQTELAGAGDLRPYGLVQFLPMVVLPFLLACRPARYLRSSRLIWAMAFYALAKVLELLDVEVFHQLGVVSGHSLKHVAAAISGLFMVTALTRGTDLPGR